jgi:hypothetical protein
MCDKPIEIEVLNDIWGGSAYRADSARLPTKVPLMTFPDADADYIATWMAEAFYQKDALAVHTTGRTVSSIGQACFGSVLH